MSEKMGKEAYQYPYSLQHKPFPHFTLFAPPQLPSGEGGDGVPHEPKLGWQPLPQKESLEPLLEMKRLH